MVWARYWPWLVFLLLSAGFAGCLGGPGLEGEDSPGYGVEDGREQVVIAVVDSGINPYHTEFRAPEGWAGPEAPGAVPVELSLDAPSLEAAYDSDMEVLRALEAGVLYSFPGTKIIGAISFGSPYGGDWPVIVDDPDRVGHGTMVASRAVGNTVSIPGDDPGVGLVLVQGGSMAVEAYEWVAKQDWIDVVVTSQSPSQVEVAVFGVPGLSSLDRRVVVAFEELARMKPFFVFAGNGVANTFTVGTPTWLNGVSGVPDAIIVGAVDNDHHTPWHNQDPYLAADGCANPAAEVDTMDGVRNRGGGTSSAGPFTSGAGVALVLEARRILGHQGVGIVRDEGLSLPEGAWDSLAPHDHQLVLARGEPGLVEGPLSEGVFTLRDLKDVLYHTALPVPVEVESDGERCGNAVIPGEIVPEEVSFPLVGYGEVNALSVEHAWEVLRGQKPLPERPDADLHYERVHTKRTLMVGQDGLFGALQGQMLLSPNL
jgi:hypothetical protein